MSKSLMTKQIDEIFAHSLTSVKRFVVDHYQVLTRVYVTALLISLAAFLFSMPVGTGDTDLWFHMNGGRYFWEFGQFPDRAFYSFFGPERTWTNYFWGFQLSAYQIYQSGGYEGLIVLRVVLVCAAVIVISRILIHVDDTPRQRAWALVLLALVVFVVSGRTDEIRPHLISYFMIPLFIFVLEKRRSWLPALPFLTVIWVNLHGIEWPVGAAVCGAYFLEAAIGRLKASGDARAVELKIMLWTALCLPAMLINPHFYEIFFAPFNTPSEAYHYIDELQTNSIWALFTVSLVGPLVSLNSAVAILNWANVFAFTHLFAHHRIRIAPAIMAVAALFLLARGKRFLWEWLLLSLPLWRLAINSLRTEALRHDQDLHNSQIGIANVLVAIVLVSPAVSWIMLAERVHHWPIDESQLPTGTAEFIKQNNIAGRLASSPNPGGYYAWRLYPDVMITSDMQIPPMTPWDHYRSIGLLRNDIALANLLTDFRPNLIAIEQKYENFVNLIEKHQHFKPVFFDDQYILYADEAQLPAITRQFELKHVNPYNLADETRGNAEERLTDLRRVHAIYPFGGRVQLAITWLLFHQKNFEEALLAAQRYAESRPGDSNSHYLVGNVLENLDRCDEAIGHFLRALEVAPSDFVAEIKKHLGSCAYLQRDFANAYTYFDESVAYFSKNEEPETLYQFALSAVAVGKEEKATYLLQQLLYTLPSSNERLKTRAEQLLRDLN